MTTAYSPEAWHDFFLAVSGAGAALAGLVFVALSINLREIIQGTGLVSRAAEAVTLLVSVVIVGLIGLVPSITGWMLGILLVLAGLPVWWLVLRARLEALRLIGQPLDGHAGPTREQWFWTAVIAEAATVPTIIAGISLVAGAGGGLYWLVPGVAFTFVASMLDAWVLLVEIQR
jgi:hypothetical protein